MFSWRPIQWENIKIDKLEEMVDSFVEGTESSLMKECKQKKLQRFRFENTYQLS